MDFKTLSTLCLAMAMTATAAVAASRGPHYEEDDDAGSLPGDSKKVEGSGPLEAISGALTGGSRGGDYQDMYEIYIAEPSKFLLRVSQVTEGFDTQLFLFDQTGRGMLANNNSQIDGQGSINAMLSNASTDGTGVVLNKPGAYFIAISGFPSRPGNAHGPIFDFNPDTPFEVSGPDGKGGDVPITGWYPNGDTGAYMIELNGVNFLPPSPGACCLSDGSCQELYASDCDANGGTFAGSGSSCGEVECSSGACCFLKEFCYWECLELSENDCGQEYAATWYGPGSRCEDIDCPDPCFGACCVGGGCVLTVQALCDAQEGTFHPYKMCSDIECQAKENCPSDINGDGSVNVIDLLALISAWGNCP
jgi:hypothetical protein